MQREVCSGVLLDHMLHHSLRLLLIAGESHYINMGQQEYQQNSLIQSEYVPLLLQLLAVSLKS